MPSEACLKWFRPVDEWRMSNRNTVSQYEVVIFFMRTKKVTKENQPNHLLILHGIVDFAHQLKQYIPVLT